jgi:hypothetical protein
MKTRGSTGALLIASLERQPAAAADRAIAEAAEVLRRIAERPRGGG